MHLYSGSLHCVYVYTPGFSWSFKHPTVLSHKSENSCWSAQSSTSCSSSTKQLCVHRWTTLQRWISRGALSTSPPLTLTVRGFPSCSDERDRNLWGHTLPLCHCEGAGGAGTGGLDPFLDFILNNNNNNNKKSGNLLCAIPLNLLVSNHWYLMKSSPLFKTRTQLGDAISVMQSESKMAAAVFLWTCVRFSINNLKNPA